MKPTENSIEDKYVSEAFSFHFLFHNALRQSDVIKYFETSLTNQNFSHKELKKH
jgi:hypothetical protein